MSYPSPPCLAFRPSRLAFFAFFLLLFFFCGLPAGLEAREKKTYDLVYIWNPDLETVLDYHQKVAKLLDPEVGKRLRVVVRGKQYGLVYPMGGSALACGQLAVKQSAALRRAGLAEGYVLKQGSYAALYNISYGSGPTPEALQGRYAELDRILGEKESRGLFIEQSGPKKYTLICRRWSDKKSAEEAARRHGRLLQGGNISPVVVLAVNNPLVFGKSLSPDRSGTTAASLETASAVSSVTARVARPSEERDEEERRIRARIARSSPSREEARRQRGGGALQRPIQDLLDELRRKGELGRDEMSGWAVYDLNRDQFLAGINAERSFQAASMVKPFVALAFFHNVQKGKLTYSATYRRQMEAMIQHSDNAATNVFIKAVGGPARCQQILRAHYGSIFKKTRIVEYIPPGGRTYLNSAAPSDYIRFLRALWKDQLPHSGEMRRVMSLPSGNRLYSGASIPPVVELYHKTGTTARLCGDMGILDVRGRNGRSYPYAIAGMIERRKPAGNYRNWMRSRGNVIRQVSGLVYKEMKERYPLQ